MWKVLSSAALSLALLGGTTVGYSSTNVSKTASATSKFSLVKPEQVAPSPEFEAFAKAHGIDMTKQAKKLASLPKGKKFNAPGTNHVTYSPTSDKIPMLVLLVKFAGEQPVGAPATQVPAKYFNDLIFGDTYNPYELPQFSKFDGPNVPKNRTMQNAYKENSYGKVTLTTDDAPKEWVTLPYDAHHYLGQDLGDLDNTNGYGHMGDLVADVLNAADAQVDFSKYAVDGVVPNVFIVHAGTGAEWSGDPQQVWSHKWDIQSALYYQPYYHDGTLQDENKFMEDNKDKWTKDGVTIGTYTIEPEIGGNVAGYNGVNGYDDALKTGPYPTQAGVFSHEFGHALGLPDLYDVDYTSQGAGNYTIMAGGSWMSYPRGNAYLGNSPTNFDPFSKMFLGWANPINVAPTDGEKTITLPPVNKAGASKGFVKMEVPGSNGTEYYLFENVQQVGFNQGLNRQGADSHGLVAWHVDENTLKHYEMGFNDVNSVESYGNKIYNVNDPENGGVTHYGLSVVQKDGKFDLEKNVNRGDAGDFFKTGDVLKSNQANVYSGSFYFFKGYNGVGLSGINVKNIKENEDGSLTATFFYQNDK
ncbi:M6 family metalloprotease domain-containing protein [Neobacillus pocheonensis]|uniref:M6 family metalloprotease domain-containing protein n=1 Tax=Neobacillus pocheonensis TaxID=363869 RepID=UPI003D2B95DF